MRPVKRNSPEDMKRILAKLPPLPRLQLEHSPGWRFERYPPESPDRDTIVVFDSDLDPFAVSFASDVFTDGTGSNSIQNSGVYWSDSTPDELADLATKTELLQTWLDDLAEVVAWETAHIPEIIEACS
ncbi:hypothetical protein [Bifidobacterium simiiventris]|uniref:hypothetical protein n=1 Tax=Bifidobacterium simiiventris TaxID=2834434 RepID=UPI001C562C80|nr:hypothetical protein [Bifidobacterium simiiventris]MBW3078226.1 hypothetical protein [Bifidobacterium simiiventris]